MSKPLTKRRLSAIEEALHARLSAEFDVDDLRREDYEAALEWTKQKIRDRASRQSGKTQR